MSPRINSKFIPHDILMRMRPEDRKAAGQLTPQEITDRHAVKLERELQKQCETYLTRHAIEYLHISHRAREKKGWPDLSFAVDGTPMAIELKTATGTLSDDQERVLAAMRRNGWQVHIVRSYQEFVRVVEAAGSGPWNAQQEQRQSC